MNVSKLALVVLPLAFGCEHRSATAGFDGGAGADACAFFPCGGAGGEGGAATEGGLVSEAGVMGGTAGAGGTGTGGTKSSTGGAKATGGSGGAKHSTGGAGGAGGAVPVGTCADLSACCSKITDPTTQEECTSSYDYYMGMDVLCAQALMQFCP